jgi:hypothetical protein
LEMQRNVEPRPFSRLAAMRRLSANKLPLLLSVALLAMLSSCGSGEDLLPGETAREINSNLDRVRSYVGEGDCLHAEDAVAQVVAQVEGLDGVAPKLKSALQQGAARLSEVVEQCEEEEEEAEPSPQSAVEGHELEEEEKRQEKQGEKEAKEAEKAEKEAEKEESKSEGPTLPPQANGEGEEKGKGGEPPAEAPTESPGAGGIGPGVEAGGD